MSNKNKKIKAKPEPPKVSKNTGIIIGAVVCVLVVALIAYLVTPHDKDTPVTSDSGFISDSDSYGDYDEMEDTNDSDAILDMEYTIKSADDFTPSAYADIEIEDYGTVTVALNEADAPITVQNFVGLAKEGFYDGLTFHRVVDGFMMQGGDPEGTGMGGSDNNITGEFAENGVANPMSHSAGAISMARSADYNSASSQFFIVDEDSDNNRAALDGKYACFGYVTDGMEIVNEICNKLGAEDKTLDKKDQPIIKKVTIRES